MALDYFAWAGRLNQLSLLPFLAFLWVLFRIPDAPRRLARSWSIYLLFIAAAIPAGLYCRAQLGTSMANVDWIHGPCEALLTLANLCIVLAMREGIRAAEQQQTGHQQQEDQQDQHHPNSTGSQSITSSIDRSSTAGDAASDPQYMQHLRLMTAPDDQQVLQSLSAAAASAAAALGPGCDPSPADCHSATDHVLSGDLGSSSNQDDASIDGHRRASSSSSAASALPLRHRSWSTSSSSTSGVRITLRGLPALLQQRQRLPNASRRSAARLLAGGSHLRVCGV